jgi:hypothetical protein
MKIRIKGRAVEVLDALCAFRPCLRPGEWKGVLTPGRGYQYAPQSAWHWRCFRRDNQGCPHPLPAPDPERARCCDAPRVRATKAAPRKQRCLTCGAWLTGFPLEVARGDILLSAKNNRDRC